MHAIARELAVPLAEHPLALGSPSMVGNALPLHQRSGLNPGDGAERRSEIDLPERVAHDRRSTGAGRRAPHHRKPHQRIGVVRAFVEEAEVTLHLAMVGREDDVRAVKPATRADRGQDTSTRLVDQLVHHVDLRVDLTDLIVGELRRNEARRSALHVRERAVR